MGIIARSGAGEPDPDSKERDQRCMPGETKAVRQAEKTEIKSIIPWILRQNLLYFKPTVIVYCFFEATSSAPSLTDECALTDG